MNRRSLKSFLSPQRNGSNITTPQGASFTNQKLTNSPSKQAECFKRPSITRDSVRPVQNENVQISGNKDKSNNDENCNNATVKKQIIIFKKFLSRSPEDKIPILQQTNFTNAMKLLERLPAPMIKGKTKISLNEMITLRKVSSTQSGGMIKRMLHVPSLNIFDVQVKFGTLWGKAMICMFRKNR